LKHNKKEEFVTFQAKLMRRFCSNALLSALIVAGLYLFVWKRRLGDVIVKVLENCLNIEHEAAFLIYHEYFRGHKEVFFGVAIVLIFLWLLWRLFWWMSNYFKEINQGIDSLLAEDNRFNSQQISLSKELVDLSLMLAQLSDKLARVFGNLLKNAAAYSYPQTEITIFATSLEDLVSISVQNKGATIPAENLPLLFDKFYRLDEARMSNTGGTGLGLAIALPATK
jgi:two-component system sensor histidine kinase VanS